jgi:hypothetical protein
LQSGGFVNFFFTNKKYNLSMVLLFFSLFFNWRQKMKKVFITLTLIAGVLGPQSHLSQAMIMSGVNTTTTHPFSPGGGSGKLVDAARGALGSTVDGLCKTQFGTLYTTLNKCAVDSGSWVGTRGENYNECFKKFKALMKQCSKGIGQNPKDFLKSLNAFFGFASLDTCKFTLASKYAASSGEIGLNFCSLIGSLCAAWKNCSWAVNAPETYLLATLLSSVINMYLGVMEANPATSVGASGLARVCHFVTLNGNELNTLVPAILGSTTVAQQATAQTIYAAVCRVMGNANATGLSAPGYNTAGTVSGLGGMAYPSSLPAAQATYTQQPGVGYGSQMSTSTTYTNPLARTGTTTPAVNSGLGYAATPAYRY